MARDFLGITNEARAAVLWDGPVSGPFTIAFWFKSSHASNDVGLGITYTDPYTSQVTTFQDYGGLVAFGVDATLQRFHVRFNGAAGQGGIGGVRCEVFGGRKTTNSAFNDGNWHQCTIVSDGVNLAGTDIYVDGSLQATNDGGATSTFGLVGNGRVDIGVRVLTSSNTCAALDGEMADVAVWTRALTSGEVTTLQTSRCSAVGTNRAFHVLLDSGTIADADANYTVAIPSDTPTVTADPAALVPAGINLTPASGALNLTGSSVTVGTSTNLNLTPASGALNLTGSSANIGSNVSISTISGSITLTGASAGVAIESTAVLTSPAQGAQNVQRPGILLEWTHPTATDFDVEIYQDAGLTILETSGSVSANSFDTGKELYNDSTYYWRVQVQGSSLWSPVASFETDASPLQVSTFPLGRGVAAITAADVTPSSIYWFTPYKAADFPEVDAGAATYFALYSTDHDAGVGGLYWGTFSNPDLSDFTEQGKIWDANDSGGTNNQTETPVLVRNPDDSNGRVLYLYFHEEDTSTNYASGVAQQTRMISSAGSSPLHTATWVDEGAVMPHSVSSPHTGYQHVVRRGTNDWISWGLDEGGAAAKFAYRTSTDGKTWAINTKPLDNNSTVPTDPQDKFQFSSFGWLGSIEGTRYLLTGIVNDMAFGGTSGRGRVGLTPLPTDTTLAAPFYVLVDMERDATGSETDNLRAVMALDDGAGTLHIYYQTDSNVFYGTASVPLVLAVDSGTLTLTGSVPAASVPLELAVDSSTLTLTGSTPAAIVSKTLVTTSASLTFTGSISAAIVSKTLAVTSSTLTFTGSPVTVGISETIAIASGSLTITGSSASISSGSGAMLSPGSGAITLTGATATVGISEVIAVASGAVTLAGSTVAANVSKSIAIASGALNLTGSAASVGTSSGVNLTPASGTLNLTGANVAVSTPTGAVLATASGALVITGSTSTTIIVSNINVSPASGAITLTGSSVQVSVPSATGTFTQADRDKLEEIHAWMSNIDGLNIQEAMRVLLAVIAGKSTVVNTGGGTYDVTYRAIDDSKNRVTADVASSSRTVVTLDET